MGQLFASQQQDQNPSQEPSDQPQVAWWCKLMAKVIGAFAGAIAIVTGIWTFVSLSALCILAGIVQVGSGLLVLIFEVPMCCMFLDITKPIAGFAERRSFFQKAIIYGLLAIIPIAMCFGMSTLFGCALIFATGVLYGLMALGKKADRDVMRMQAEPANTPGDTAVSGTGNKDASAYPNPFSDKDTLVTSQP